VPITGYMTAVAKDSSAVMTGGMCFRPGCGSGSRLPRPSCRPRHCKEKHEGTRVQTRQFHPLAGRQARSVLEQATLPGQCPAVKEGGRKGGREGDSAASFSTGRGGGEILVKKPRDPRGKRYVPCPVVGMPIYPRAASFPSEASLPRQAKVHS
jgi:hypothetical protein